MQYVIPPIKKNYLTPKNTPSPLKNTEDNFYEVQRTKCTKTLYQTDTIRPILWYRSISFFTSVLLCRE